MSNLRRTKVDQFRIEDAVLIEKLEKEQLKEKIISLEEVFKQKEEIHLTTKEWNCYLNGVLIETEKSEEPYRIYLEQQFRGLGIVQNHKLKREIVLDF